MLDLFQPLRNIFLGTKKKEDSKYNPPEGEYLPELGDVDYEQPSYEPPSYEPPDVDYEKINEEWFPKSNRYAPPEKVVELESNPRPEEEVSDWFSIEKPDESDVIEEEKTMHQKMYEMATARYNPFSLGGSENCDSDISCEVQKHSPWPGGSENFQGGSERIQK